VSVGGGRDSYSINAEFWTKIIRDGLDRYRVELTDGAVLDALGVCRGLRVLDAGCGEGYLSRRLASEGAEVTGIDLSPNLVDAARTERDRLGLRAKYYASSIEAIDEPDGSFDVVVCNHVMNDLADPDRALRELGRVAKPGGKLVILMLHPCFNNFHSSAEYAPGDESAGHIPAESYFSARSVVQPFNVAGLTSPAGVRCTFRPLEQYTSALFRGGFILTSLSEPHPTSEQLEDPWWRANFEYPLFLLLQAERR
jgi:SAM-dependent methyltransferase